MARIYPHILFGSEIIPSEKATLHVASSAVLYGLSVYTVFPVLYEGGKYRAFRLDEHMRRLVNSAKLIGIALPPECAHLDIFASKIGNLLERNDPQDMVFVRATIHVDALVPGTKSRGLHTILSAFLYEAQAIVPQK
jgi:branched-chain amino acid aminotransferase